MVYCVWNMLLDSIDIISDRLCAKNSCTLSSDHMYSDIQVAYITCLVIHRKMCA
jgi:hypothetical protein